jgi:sugar phosphate isomerase/epimerase
MIKLGFVSAILGNRTFEEVITFAAEHDFECVEVLCEPAGKTDRRYGGIAHIDVESLTAQKAQDITTCARERRVRMSALAYYQNTMHEDEAKQEAAVRHLLKVIDAAAMLGLRNVNAFAGRVQSKPLAYNFGLFKEIWTPIVRHAESKSVKIGIENCPMYFTRDEWPNGWNIAYCPANWRKMFELVPSDNLGLNYDPSHLLWLQIDYVKPLYEFKDKIFHVHIKDTKMLKDKLDDVGILATPLEFHAPKLPGLGDVQWGRFISALTDIGFRDCACIEVEDLAYQKESADIEASLVQSNRFMRQFIA